MAIVYIITCKKNSKSYIGQSIRSLEARWAAHLSAARGGSPFRFHSAIRKYGQDQFDMSVLFEHEDVNIVKQKEEQLIAEYNTMEVGYNARPGNTGGWVVKPENYKTWLTNNTIACRGAKNGNALSISNDEIIEHLSTLSRQLGYVPGFKTFLKYTDSINVKIPKNFRQYRFEGKYSNLANIVADRTRVPIKPLYSKSLDHRKSISLTLKGKTWWSCIELNKQQLILDPNELDQNYNWHKGKLISVKNRNS